jgi:hypothetical protein
MSAEVRKARKDFRTSKPSAQEAADLIASPPRWAERWQVNAILRCITGLGPHRVAVLMHRLLIVPDARLDELSGAARDELVATLNRVGDERPSIEKLRGY